MITRSRCYHIAPFIAVCLLVYMPVGAQVIAPIDVPAQETQPLSLSEAVQTGVSHYQSIQAKRHYMQASTALVQNTRNEYLPNVVAGLQQNYGTANGQLGPMGIVIGAQGVASAGPSNASQNWDAGFGAMYLINTTWEFFSFGRLKSKISLYSAAVQKDSADIVQEQFVHSVKISGAYLSLLTSQKLVQIGQSNLDRAIALQQVVIARTRTGLNAGVDSSFANAEVSRARLALIDARNNELQLRNQLAIFLNVIPTAFALDTFYTATVPAEFKTNTTVNQNPQVKYFQSRIDQSDVATVYLRKSILPGVNLFGVFQTRASGFDYDYSPGADGKFTHGYWDGVKPTRSNYVAGISIGWNIMSLAKIKQQVKAQQYLTEAYKSEYDQINAQLKNQLILADQRIDNSLQSVREVPLQYKAASDAYLQKTVLYKNGLTNIVDLQQALYALNRAETDRYIAYINVWQSLLQKAAASGDFDLFIRQVK